MKINNEELDENDFDEKAEKCSNWVYCPKCKLEWRYGVGKGGFVQETRDGWISLKDPENTTHDIELCPDHEFEEYQERLKIAADIVASNKTGIEVKKREEEEKEK